MNLPQQVYEANLALAAHGLVAWTGGNVSALDRANGTIVIKPSGVQYSEMTVNDMVVVDMDGKVVAGQRAPSSDTQSHLGIYRQRDDVESIVHTHSRYATAFAAVGRPIPCYLTAIADEFGGDIPCAPYASIGGEEIGQAVVEHIGHSPAILLRGHGVFTLGPTITKALQAAVMVEDVAHTVAIAETLGTPTRLTPAQIAENYDRYQHRYGTHTASEGIRR